MGSFYVKSIRKLDPCPPCWRDPQLDLEIGFQKKITQEHLEILLDFSKTQLMQICNTNTRYPNINRILWIFA